MTANQCQFGLTSWFTLVHILYANPFILPLHKSDALLDQVDSMDNTYCAPGTVPGLGEPHLYWTSHHLQSCRVVGPVAGPFRSLHGDPWLWAYSTWQESRSFCMFYIWCLVLNIFVTHIPDLLHVQELQFIVYCLCTLHKLILLCVHDVLYTIVQSFRMLCIGWFLYFKLSSLYYYCIMKALHHILRLFQGFKKLKIHHVLLCCSM